MRIAAYFGAVISFTLVYLGAAIATGVLVSAYADWASKSGPAWWVENGVPFVIVIIAATAGVFVASATTSRLFPKLSQWRVSLAFIAILLLHQVTNLILIVGRQDWSIIDVRSAVMALTAIVTVFDTVPSYNRR